MIKERRPNGFFSKMKDDELVAYAQKYIDDNEITNPGGNKGLQKIDSGLFDALFRRKLARRMKFEADERKWGRYSDDELVEYSQKFIDDNKITHSTGKGGLVEIAGGLYTALIKRSLIRRLKFEADERKWKRYSDDALVAYAQRLIDDNEIAGLSGKGGLTNIDCTLYVILCRRKLVGKLKFEEDKYKWVKYSDDALVAYAQRFIDDNEITNQSGKNGLKEMKSGLYSALYTRKLIEKLTFKDKNQEWISMTDNELVKYAQKYIKDNDIANSSGENGLKEINSGLYGTLYKRKLLNRVFAPIEADQKRQAEDEIEKQLDHAVDAYLSGESQ
ncbi:MAG: hypothetical protein NTY68_02990 [Candidatus Micrarchaeota archaeon]|nr:hypothetical protein [Candidatus Micrarchaeota archaeon]